MNPLTVSYRPAIPEVIMIESIILHDFPLISLSLSQSVHYC